MNIEQGKIWCRKRIKQRLTTPVFRGVGEEDTKQLMRDFIKHRIKQRNKII